MSERPMNRSSEELAMREIVSRRMRDRWPTARIVHELPLRYSSNRIDLAAITETEIIGAEIKSSKDVLDRLEAQIIAFLPVTHRLWVCLAPKHNPDYNGQAIPQLSPAQKIISRVADHWVEVWSVDVETGESWGGGHLSAREMRMPWSARMLDMLWNTELAQLVGGSGGDRHDTLVARANRCLTGAEVVRGVCRMLRAGDAFRAASDPPIVAHRNLLCEAPHA